MSPVIYPSTVPSVVIPDISIFTYLFSSSKGSKDVGGHAGSSPAYIDAATGTSLSRLQTKSFSLAFGHGILNHPRLSDLRLQKGDVVMVYSPNSLLWPIVMFGSMAAGLKCTLANSAYTARELAYQYADSGAKLILCNQDGVKVVQDMFDQLKIKDGDNRIVVLGNSLDFLKSPSAVSQGKLLAFEALLQTGSLSKEEELNGKKANTTAYLCYSSGTTGKPKGVETTHKNLVSVLKIIEQAMPKIDNMLGILPFYHIYGLVKLVHFPFARGIPVVLQTRFDPIQFCANVEKYNITASLIVPPVLVILANHAAVDQYNMKSLKWMLSGAAPLGDALVKQVTTRFKSRFSNPEFVIVQGYGLTETSPTTHILPSADAITKIGSIGILLANLEARIVDDLDGKVDAEAGQPGEIWIRGPTVMKGYLNNVAATKDSITDDGWFKTGDVAVRDKDGYYYIVDRRKELIKYKGFQVPPAELESVLLSHPDIADAAVIGVQSVERATELPRAYIVHAQPDLLKSDTEKAAFAKSVAVWIESRVARHKFLRGGVVVIDVIPKSAAGKILRRELRERAKIELITDVVRSKL